MQSLFSDVVKETMYIEFNREIKFNEINAVRNPGVNYANLIIPNGTENLVIDGDPRSIYRTLLNAADKLRKVYGEVGLDFGFDCRVVD